MKKKPRPLTMDQYDLLTTEQKAEYVDAILDALAPDGPEPFKLLTDKPSKKA